MELDNIIRQINKEEQENEYEKIKTKDYILKPFIESVNENKDKINTITKKLPLTGSYIIDSFELSFFTYFLQGFTSVEYSTSLLFSGIDKKLKSIDVYVLTRYIRNELLFSYDLTKNKITICDKIINITSNKDLDFLLKNYVKRFDIEKAFANYVKSLLEE